MKDDDYRRHEGDDYPRFREVGKVEEVVRLIALLGIAAILLFTFI